MASRGELLAELITFTRDNNTGMANMTSTLRLVDMGNGTMDLNGMIINCTEHIGTIQTTQRGTIITAVPPSPPTVTLPGYKIQQYDSDNATIVMEWGEPEDNGWAPVDNYTISVSGLGVSTTVTARQVVLVLPYNMPLVIAIVATNCAGSSDTTLVEYFITNCGDPSVPVNGTIEAYTNTTGGAVILFKCLQGFAPAGRMSSTCLSSGSWSPDPADLNCTLVDCGLPQSPANGSVSLQDPDNTTFGAVVMIHCVEGLILEGNRTVAVCSESGVWIPEPSEMQCIPAETDMPSTTGSDDQNTGCVTVVTVVIVAIVNFLLSFATGTVVGGLVCYWFTRKERKSQCVSCPKEQARPSVYEDVGPPRGDIEMKENVAYGPV